MTTIIIEVTGGLVESVYTNKTEEEIQVVVLDYDMEAQGDEFTHEEEGWIDRIKTNTLKKIY